MPEPYSKDRLNIRTLRHLALRLGFPVEELQKAAENAEQLYRFFEREEGNGKVRELSDARPRLKKIQQSIHRLFQEIVISNCAHGGVKGRSHLTNARVHCGAKRLFKLDFKKCFPNISNRKVYRLFVDELGCLPEVASLLTRLCTVRYQVPQGGPMSTDIANLVCRRIDKRLEGLATKYDLEYTRLVDDTSFSGECIPKSFRHMARRIIEENGFKLNYAKEAVMGRHQLMTVTGLSINRKRPHVPREKRRQIRKEKYLFEKYESRNLTEEDRKKRQRKINGKSAYLAYINQATSI